MFCRKPQAAALAVHPVNSGFTRWWIDFQALQGSKASCISLSIAYSLLHLLTQGASLNSKRTLK